MMDAGTIRRMSEEAAKTAAREKKTPYVPYDVAEVQGERFSIPFLGTYVPKGWKKVDSWFCDSSGFGREGEAALTIDQMKAKIIANLEDKATYGYAITEQGQFQCFITVYKKQKKGVRHGS